MKLWIDADAAPRDVKEICYRVSDRLKLETVLVAKGVHVIDPRGDVYTEENIGERLSVRNFMDGLRMGGTDTGGHSQYGAKEKQAFANAIDRALTRALRRRT